MARLQVAASGKSLGLGRGFAGLSARDAGYIVRRSALTGLSIGVLVIGLVTASTAQHGVADAGVVADNAGGVVLDVAPTGYAWASGIRVGQRVVFVGASDDPDGWRMVTSDGQRTFEAAARAPDDALVQTLPLGVVAVAFAYLAVLLLRTRRGWVLPAAACSLLAASVPATASGNLGLATAVLGLALAVPIIGVLLALPGGRRGIAIGATALISFLAAWAWERAGGTLAAATLEDVRSGAATWATIGLVGLRIVVPALAGEPLPMIRPRLVDVTLVTALASLVVVAIVGVGLPAVTVAVAILAVLAVIPVTRRRLGRGIEDALFGDVRAAAAADAAEQERARLARELHDVPLQELAAVIRRLDILPGAEKESEDLRALAGHLRNVAADLRPPVLDDLGLPAAIDFLAEEATSARLPVVADVVDDTGFGAERRPPTEVELAMFRIASEAVGNALRHSGGSGVQIHAEVAPDRVKVVVADDGSGLDSARASGASRRKRLGLASMRRRAEAIDAELSIDGSSRGTAVTVVWQA